MVSGDTHGEFDVLIHKVCVQQQMCDTLTIVAGDSGFGFEKKDSYKKMVSRNAKRMDEANKLDSYCSRQSRQPHLF